ncbi:hypothetical protein C2W62_50515 [Candidatus Entotheonella serta]|nr:hypothetical protein C2W62_50515 [Candidatus Entotheonella serta]
MMLLIIGLFIAACTAPLRQQRPDAIAVEHTLETFWTVLRSGDRTSLERQLTTDATLIRMDGRSIGEERPLSMVLGRPEERTLLVLAERERLIKFQQPTPQRASVETFLDVTRQDGVHRGRIQWEFVRNDGKWLLQRVKTSIWIFPNPSRGGGP